MSKLPLVDGVHDRRLEAWCETTSDKFSTQWVTAFPCFRWFLTNAEFTQVAAAYLGLASPACLALVGKKVDRSSSRLDRYGDALTSVKQCSGQLKTRHDSAKHAMFRTFKWMHIDVEMEALNVFSQHIPQAQLSESFRTNESRMKTRQGIVPDFVAHIAHDGPKRRQIFELKFIGKNKTRYPMKRDLTQERCVDKRADGLTKEYEKKARNGDKKYCGTQGDTKGPILRTLESLGDVKGLVWGAFGEGSIQCHRLASTLAEIGSQMHYKTMHVATPQIAKSVLVRAIRRDWGLAVVKANAHTILTNLSKVGNNVKAASERREALEQQWADEAADTQAMFDAFRGMRGGNTWWC